eukprot:scaffold2193_cov171-Amphora_coffeaeformis.AAC.10
MMSSRSLFGLLFLVAGFPLTCSTTPSLLQLVGAHSHHDQKDNHHDKHHHRCATAEPTLRDQLFERLRFDGAFGKKNNRRRNNNRRVLFETDCTQLCNQCIEIGVNLHLIGWDVQGEVEPFIPHPTDTLLAFVGGTASRQDLSTADDIIALFQANVGVVNRAFEGTPFRFTFTPSTTTTTANNEWSFNATDFVADMSRALGSGDLRQLDVFVVWSLVEQTIDSTSVVLGQASYSSLQLADEGDGVLLRYDTLTGGGLAPLDYGYTLTHEIGKS